VSGKNHTTASAYVSGKNIHGSPTLLKPRTAIKKYRWNETYPGGVGAGTQRYPSSHARRFNSCSTAVTGPSRAWPPRPQAIDKKAGTRCATMRTTPNFHTWRMSKHTISYKRQASVARPRTVARAGTNAKALNRVRKPLRCDGRGSSSRKMAPSSWASRVPTTSRSGARAARRSPATSLWTRQCVQKKLHACPIRHMTARSASWSDTKPVTRGKARTRLPSDRVTDTPVSLAPANRRSRMARHLFNKAFRLSLAIRFAAAVLPTGFGTWGT